MRRLLSLALLLVPSALLAGELIPYSAEYRLTRGDTTLGKARAELERDGDCYVYRYIAKPSFIMRWITGSISERSRFCLADGQMVPDQYRYHRSGMGAKDENYSLDFDPVAGIVTDHKGDQRELPPGAIDRLLVQLAARRLVEDLSLPLGEVDRRLALTTVQDDRIKTYVLAVAGTERITVPAGNFDTIIVERVKDTKKSTRFWTAPALNYQLVKMEQIKNGEPTLGFELRELPEFAEEISPAAAESGAGSAATDG